MGFTARVITPKGHVRLARITDEVVMTSRGYAQPATISIKGKRVKGFVQTAESCRTLAGNLPFFTELVLPPAEGNPNGDDLNLPPTY